MFFYKLVFNNEEYLIVRLSIHISDEELEVFEEKLRKEFGENVILIALSEDVYIDPSLK